MSTEHEYLNIDMDRVRIISGQRQTGRTTKLVELALADTNPNPIIISCSAKHAHYLINHYKLYTPHNLMPAVRSIEYFMFYYKSSINYSLYVDDFDIIMKSHACLPFFVTSRIRALVIEGEPAPINLREDYSL